MDLVEGPTLEAAARESSMTVRRGLELVAKVARAVQHAHERGVVHRDLKPANVLIDTRGEPLVADFGLAKEVSSKPELTRTGQMLGTPGFMAPEQARGRHAADVRTDVYGLGATLYAVLTGAPPHQGRDIYDTLYRVMNDEPLPPRRANPGVLADVETIVAKCLEKDPARRYPTAHDVAEEIERWLDGRPILAHPPSLAYRLRRLLVRRRAINAGMSVPAPSLLVSPLSITMSPNTRPLMTTRPLSAEPCAFVTMDIGTTKLADKELSRRSWMDRRLPAVL
jgi:serine/threonine protein kinase